MAKKTVFVGLSGGVDSAVSAALLKKRGYEVVGVFIKTWHPDFLECNEEEERRDSMRNAARLGIPFLTFDLEKVYKREVADYMIREYRTGRTPNPDVMCNKEVKFGAFLKKSLAMGADLVATGHYARNMSQNFSGFPQPPAGTFPVKNFATYSLTKGTDPTKDQSYFLWTLKQSQLKRILFPVGHFKKTEVRKLAKKFGLPVAEKKDSQGICFLGAVDLKEFLKHYIKVKKGKVLLALPEVGNVAPEEIGYHDGAAFHTLGERHGFTITKKSPNDRPYYIIAKDTKKNTLTISHNQDISHSNILTNIGINKTNWISKTPEPAKNYTAQVRYHGKLLACKVKVINKTKSKVIFTRPVLAAPGQSCVIYDKDICLGGGIIV